jgi:hypothetical protein
MPTPIVTHTSVAAAVAALRVFDAENRTDNAISEVAETLHLSPETVAEIARDVSHELALFENQRRSAAAQGAKQCQGCGACACERAGTAYDPLTAGEIAAFL